MMTLEQVGRLSYFLEGLTDLFIETDVCLVLEGSLHVNVRTQGSKKITKVGFLPEANSLVFYDYQEEK